MPAVDIVVATRNRPDDLKRLLASLTNLEDDDFGVVIIDQSDDPSMNAAAVGALHDPRFVHVETITRGKSLALNEAIRSASRAPVMVFTDDDCEVPPDWLRTISSCMQRHPEAGIVYGQLIAATHDPAEFFVPAIKFERERVFSRSLLRSHGLLGMGANMIIRRSTFERVGLFDEDLGPGGRLFTGEECELMYRSLNSGIVVVQDPTIRMLHWGLRPYEGGVAHKVLAEGFYATMAGHGKHLRQGDWKAVPVTVHETLWSISGIIGSILHMRRPLHIRHFGLLLSGLWAGFRRGPNWPSLASEL